MSSSIPSTSNARNGRRKLVLLLLLFSAPIALSYAMYYWFRPSEMMNYGELTRTEPLSDMSLRTAEGGVRKVDEFKGKWILLHVDSGVCLDTCRHKLYLQRQIRLALGKDQERVERMFLIRDSKQPEPALERDYAGTRFLYTDAEVMKRLPAQGEVSEHIYLIDPLGNLVLRYPPDPDASRIVKDLQRLLKVSRIG